MSIPRQLFRTGALARPMRGDADVCEFVGAMATPRASFDPFARRAQTRGLSPKVSPMGWKILTRVLGVR